MLEKNEVGNVNVLEVARYAPALARVPVKFTVYCPHATFTAPNVM